MVALPAYGPNSAPTDRFWIASAAIGFAAGTAADRYITPDDFLAEITRNVADVSIQFGNGAGISTVSSASKGKLRYNATVQSFQVSENAGAYVNLIKGSGVATRVAFWSGTSTLSSNSDFYWDDVNERLGVGVGSSPGAPIDVLADGTALAQQWRQNGGPLRMQMILDNVPEASLGTSTNHTFHLLTNNTQRLTIENGGRVGINKASVVQAQLQVVALDATTPNLILNTASTPSVNIAEFYNVSSLRFAFSPSANLTIGLAGGSGATGSLSFAVNGQANLTTLRAGTAPVSANTILLPSDDPAANEFLKVTSFAGNQVVTEWASGSGGTTINPTDGVMPVRSNATTFIDSPLSVASSAVTMTRTAIGTAQSDGIILLNSTAAAAGAQQYSPMIRLTGFGWKTNATAASQQADWVFQAQPVQGAAAPTVNLVFLSQINTGGFVQQFSVTSGAIAQIGTTGGTLYFGNSNHSITCSDASNTMSFAPSGGTVSLSLTSSFLRVPQGSGADAAGIQGLAAAGNNDISFSPQARGGNTGAGGSLYIHGGTGSTSGTPSVGGNAHLYGGAGGTNQNGGNAYIYGGALNGSGINGNVYLGYNGSAILGGIFIQGTDLSLVRHASSVLRVTDGSTGLGSILIGTSTDSLTGNFTILGSNAATNSLVAMARIGVNSTGIAADGFGAYLSWSAETNTTNDQETSRNNVFWSTATHASRTSARSWSMVNNATLAEVMRLTTPSNNIGSPFVLNIHGGTNPNVWTAGAFAAKLYLIDATLPAVGVAAHFSTTGADAPAWQLLRGRGTNASPTAVQSTDRLGAIQFCGQTSTSTNNFAIGAEIRVSTTENWSAGNNGCTMIFLNSNNGGTLTERGRITETGTWRIGASSGTFSTTNLLQVGNYASWSSTTVAAFYSGANANVAMQIIGTNGQTGNLLEIFRDSITPNLLTVSAPGVLGVRAGLNTGTLQARVGGVVHEDFTPVSNSGAVETNLMSWTMPGNVLGTDNDELVLDQSGEIVAPTGAIQLRVYFDGDLVFDTGAILLTAGAWRFMAAINRGTSTDTVSVCTYSGDLAALPVNCQTRAQTATLSGPVIVKVTGQALTSDEIFQTRSVISWFPAAA